MASDGQDRGTATLFNDRYGMHRIYYHESKEAFYFARGGKGDFGRTSRAASGRSAKPGRVCRLRLRPGKPHDFKDIHVLPAASAWVFETARSSKEIPISPARVGEPESPRAGGLLPELRECSRGTSRAISTVSERVGMT